MWKQEVAQLEEVTPATTCIKAEIQMWSICLRKPINQSTKTLQKIWQARKYIHNVKQQKRKQANKQKNEQDGCHHMPKIQK